MPADGRIRRLPLALAAASSRSNRGGVGEGADRGHQQVRATLEDALAVAAHGLVPGAFGDGVEPVRKEAVGLVGQQAPMVLGIARPLHQGRDQFQVLDAACLQRRLDMLADGAVADQAELQAHESLRSTQRAQAMSWSSLSRGPMSCTDKGMPNGPVLNGSAMQGVPRSVQKRLKIGIAGIAQARRRLALGRRREQDVELAPGVVEMDQGAALALAGVGVLPAGDGVALGHDAVHGGREEVGEAPALLGVGLRRLLGHDAMLGLHQAFPAVGRLPFAHARAGGAQGARGLLDVLPVVALGHVPPRRADQADARRTWVGGSAGAWP